MCSNSGVKANTLDDLPGIKTLELSVCIKLIKVADTKCKVSVCKELNCLSLCKAHEKSINILFLSTLNKKVCKYLCLLSAGIIASYNDSARIQVVVKSLGLTKELW